MRPFLTVLTTPIQSLPRRLYRLARSRARPFIKPGVPSPTVSSYPGHYSLVRSVVKGLTAIGADFNFNPASFRQLARVVYAPANEALRQAAELKRRGDIDKLVAGPVNALFPDECDGILRLEAIDWILVASSWVCDFFRTETPELVPKLRISTCGVDESFWTPSPRSRPRGTALVYWKSAPESFYRDVRSRMERSGFVARTIRYGDYRAEDYREALDQADLAVFLSTFETQGLALAEAWSMDVPTVVWDSQGEAEWKGQVFRSGSSCPYLSEATGRTFRTLPDLDAAVSGITTDRDRLHPRAWVLANMTDAICARTLYDLLKQ